MSEKDAAFSSQALREQLPTHPRPRRYLVGFSGGADSTALLVALQAERSQLGVPIEAIHFNHGLQAAADAWQRHCKEFCSARDIPFTCISLDLSGGTANLESRARRLRYRHLEKHIDEHTLYLTAHNADDRAETFLLHALRGSGLDGLASIPRIRPLGAGHVARPLLDFSRAAIQDYLTREGVDWVEDPSNQDPGMDRNFMRLEVLPLLESRWPAARHTLARTAGQSRRASTLLEKLVVRHARLDQHDELALPLAALHSLGEDAASFILRAWLRRQGAPSLPEARMEEFLTQLSGAAPGAQCETAWAGWALRLFKRTLRLVPPGGCPTCPEREWDGRLPLELGPEHGTVQISGAPTQASGPWTIGPRRTGATVQLHRGGPSRKVKRVLQEQAVPPWQRASIPVLYRNDQVMAVGDWLFSPEFSAWLSEHGCQYRWEPAHPELRQTRLRCTGGKGFGGPA